MTTPSNYIVIPIMPWVYSPHTGGSKIPPTQYSEISRMVENYASKQPWHEHITLQVKFKTHFCYIGTMRRDDDYIFPLCRLRYFSKDKWSMALYTYSNERYEPCFLPNGEDICTVKEALETCETFIDV